MKQYGIKVTEYALGQMQETVRYLTEIKLSPEIAQDWLQKMYEGISKLSYMPERVSYTTEENWVNRGIHKLILMNYYVYFWIEEKSDTVWVIAVVYAGRDQQAQLDQMDDYYHQ